MDRTPPLKDIICAMQAMQSYEEVLKTQYMPVLERKAESLQSTNPAQAQHIRRVLGNIRRL